MKILSIVGARPQFVKCATVSRQLRRVAVEVLVHTGQHYDDAMSGSFFRELEIPTPDYFLGVGSGTHARQTARMLEAIEQTLFTEQPDIVLVYGDTNSTLAGALAAAKLNITVAHVEAGLRSHNRAMPEEINRILTDHVASILFTTGEIATANLVKEGVANDLIYEVGDVMRDATLHFSTVAARSSQILQYLKLEPRQYILATIHRAENTDDPQRLRSIFRSFQQLSRDHRIVLPLHPRTRKSLLELEILKEVAADLLLIEPVGYLDMLNLQKNALLIATDSGGVQKEAYYHRVPCVTVRDETEWPELVSAGWNRLASPADAEKIVQMVLESIGATGSAVELYGNGSASEAIANALQSVNGAPDAGSLLPTALET